MHPLDWFKNCQVTDVTNVQKGKLESVSSIFCHTVEQGSPVEVPELELFVHPIQQYATFPRANVVFGRLFDRQLANLGYVDPSRYHFPNDWAGKFIIVFGSVYKNCDTGVCGFMAFIFEEKQPLRYYFVPGDTPLGSMHYALCIK